MSTITKTFSFASTVESWSWGGSGTATWESADGSPDNGCLSVQLTGKNQNPGVGYWVWTGTFEDLGVPSGATISDVGTSGIADFNWRCSEYTTGTGTNSVGPFAIYDNQATPVIIGTFSTEQTSVDTTATWATVDGSAVTGLSLASNTIIQLWMAVTVRTGPHEQRV